MTQEKWKAYWERVDKMPLTTPIAWTCRHCAYPGEVRLAHEVPGFCPYCGTKVAHADIAQIEKRIEAQRAAVERDALARWWRDGLQLSLPEVAHV